MKYHGCIGDEVRHLRPSQIEIIEDMHYNKGKLGNMIASAFCLTAKTIRLAKDLWYHFSRYPYIIAHDHQSIKEVGYQPGFPRGK